jgi:general secretion pathway protein A
MSAAILGPAGSGKSVLARELCSKLPDARYKVHYVKVTSLSKRDMCREICNAIGAAPAGSYPMLVRRIQERFLAIADVDALRPVLILDEAHDLRPEVLAMLRVLTNFQMDSRLVVSIVLVGQPKLQRILQCHDLEDVARRIAHYAQLRPLSREQSNDYVKHRCNIAGARKAPFDGEALSAIYEIARGNFRATDQLALKALNVAHLAQHKVVDSNHVAEARKFLCG